MSTFIRNDPRIGLEPKEGDGLLVLGCGLDFETFAQGP